MTDDESRRITDIKMAYTFCNQCGHRNPPDSAFCSSCGSPLDVLDDRTITLTAVDPLQDGIGPDDDLVIPIGELPRDTPVLILRAGSNAGERFALTGEITRIGRHPESEIPLDDITVSRRHAEVHRTDNGYMLADAGSLNGTYLNQERVERAPIQHGDEVQVGKFRLVYFERNDA